MLVDGHHRLFAFRKVMPDLVLRNLEHITVYRADTPPEKLTMLAEGTLFFSSECSILPHSEEMVILRITISSG